MNRPGKIQEGAVGVIMQQHWGKWVFAVVCTLSLLYFAWLLF